MTGRDLTRDALIEIAVLVTDFELTVLGDGVDLVITPPDGALTTMPERVRRMHTESGLLERHDSPARFRAVLSPRSGVGRVLEEMGIRREVLAVLLPEWTQERTSREIFEHAYEDDASLIDDARADIMAVFERDPACHRLIQPLLYFKGFQALQAYRVGHWLWTEGRRDMAYYVQMRVSEVFGVDIHHAARIGKGIMIDHAHSIVIGETAVVGDNVSMLHAVTLGGTGKEGGDRHPKIGDGVLIGAGAKVLGNISIGACSRIAAGSVVLKDVPPCKTVAFTELCSRASKTRARSPSSFSTMSVSAGLSNWPRIKPFIPPRAVDIAWNISRAAGVMWTGSRF